ncbi:uncharacterized protein LOC127505660 isoform X2 [Ctenopharyngodon idella]|uniref:uncharacterized protein LOC127505660 isoform X2 n=1 Tax=Ctenopharyngodon idella TaxID=7959 RepID=UPI00222F0471|nr:uncharacterized protein LOC127505660 isoform X2 [Ctenopharyngodon idella]
MAEWKMLCLPSVLLLWPQIFSTTLQDNGHPGSGCLTTTDTKVLMKYLRSYKLQHKPLFPVDAVRFLTIKGNTICSDPSSPWAIKAMKYLDAKKKPQSASSTAHQSVTAAPTKISMINTKSAQSSTTQIWSTPVKKQVYSYTQNLKDIIGHNTQKTESKAEFPTPRTTLEQDWRGSTETTFQLDGLAWEEEEEDAVTGSACLTTTDTEVPLNNLRSYTLQHKPLFPVDAVSSTTQIWSTPVKKQVYSYTQILRDIIGHTTQKTESKTEFSTPKTTLEQDWRGSTETTETFQLDGLAWEEEKPTTMNEPFIDKFYVPIPTSCLTTTDTEVPLNNLRSYTLQHKPLFPVDAVRFLTIKGNTICLDPSSPWAVNSMKYLDAKKKPQSASARQSVTAAPKKMSTINTKSAPSSTIQIWSTPVKKQVYSYTQNLKDIIGHNTQKTESKAEFPTPRTTLEQDWRGSTETTFQLDGLAWEEEKPTTMNEPFIDKFCLKGEQVKYSDP